MPFDAALLEFERQVQLKLRVRTMSDRSPVRSPERVVEPDAKQWIRKALASEATDPGMRAMLAGDLDALESPELTQEKCR